eukprot:364471_1
MVSLIAIMLVTTFINIITSTASSYVADFEYSYRSCSRSIIDQCSSNNFIENGTTYQSHDYYCDNNQVFVNFFAESKCERSIICYSVEDENSEINTCNETGGYIWYHEVTNTQHIISTTTSTTNVIHEHDHDTPSIASAISFGDMFIIMFWAVMWLLLLFT